MAVAVVSIEHFYLMYFSLIFIYYNIYLRNRNTSYVQLAKQHFVITTNRSV